MSVPVVLRAEAQAEFEEAFDNYEGQRPGRGVKFVNQVQKVFDRIASNPDLYALVLADIRKAAVSRFPYSVYYRSEIARVEVIAVFHTSRDPSIWKGRI
jgi:toxin ParE1/3/4